MEIRFKLDLLVPQLRDADLPNLTPTQLAAFSILCAREVFPFSEWCKWANNWLERAGTDNVPLTLEDGFLWLRAKKATWMAPWLMETGYDITEGDAVAAWYAAWAAMRAAEEVRNEITLPQAAEYTVKMAIKSKRSELDLKALAQKAMAF